MTGVFDDFVPVLPEILKELDALKHQSIDLDEMVLRISEVIYSKANLYVLIGWVIRGEHLIAVSSFSKDLGQLESFKESLSKKAINLNPPKIITDYVISSGNPRFWTDSERYNKIFWSAIFNLTSSEIYLPLKKQGEVFGVLQMGSNDIVELAALTNSNDDLVMQLNWQVLDLFLQRINETLNSSKD